MKGVKIKPVLFTSKVYSNNTHPIMVRTTKDRKLSYESIGHSVPIDAWDKYEARVFTTRPKVNEKSKADLPVKIYEYYKKYSSKAIILSNAKSINADIEDRLAEITLTLAKMKANEEHMDLSNIKLRLRNKNEAGRHESILKFGEEMRDNYLSTGNVGTYKRYKTVLKRVSEYLKGKDLKYSDLTVQFLKQYEIHLKKESLKTNSIYNQFKTIRAMYYGAIKEGIIDGSKNPFLSFKLRTDNNSKKEKLAITDIKKIESLDLVKNSSLWHTRNYFIFSFNVAGLRISDMMLLKWKHIDKMGRLNYNMHKTGGFKSLQLSPRAVEIVGYYKSGNKKSEDFIFPLLSDDESIETKLGLHNQISAKTVIINKNLKKLAEKAEIEIKLTTHIARHSFADIARQKIKDVHAIKNLLGHSSISITEKYLKSLDYTSQDEALKNILDL